MIPTEDGSCSEGHLNVSSHFKICIEYCVPQRHDCTACKSSGVAVKVHASDMLGQRFSNWSWKVLDAYNGRFV